MAMRVHAADLTNLQVGRALAVNAQGRRLVLCRPSPEEIYALDDTCSHAQAFLSDGRLQGYEIECPRHGALFDIRTGEALTLPATRPVHTYPVVVEGNSIFVEVPE